MRIPCALALAFAIVGPSSLYAQAQTSLGRGCTTATYIDKDCDGYGVGKKASATYPLGENSSWTVGDLPDADDEDPTVNTTASWESKWNGGIAAFLSARRGFTNTSRIWYISQTGNDQSGVVNDKAHPFRTTYPARLALSNGQGGVIVIRGGTWTDLVLTDCDYTHGDCGAPFTGSPGHPLYIMAYPGERVITSGVFEHRLNSNASKTVGNMTVDGLTFSSASAGLGDAILMADTDHVTVRNCEFAGWHQIMFGDHSEDASIEDNVFHDMGTHAIYFATGNMYSQGAVDFDFAADAAAYAAGTSVGASYRANVLRNIIYNSGYGGFEAIHINTIIEGVLVEGNIVSYSCGALGLQSGVYDAVVRNNVFFDNAKTPIVLSLYGPDNQAATIRHISIENNTIWVGSATDVLRSASPGGAIAANDYGDASGHWIKDVTVRNNIIAVDASDPVYGNHAITFCRNSYPGTWIFESNLFWGSNASPSPSDRVMAITSLDCNHAGADSFVNYSFTQFAAYNGGWTGNLFADPKLKAVSTGYLLSPWQFDLGLTAGSPAIKAGHAGSATVDVRQLVRSSPLDIGAYSSSSGPGAAKNVSVK